MNLEQIKTKIKSEEYDFLRKDKNLGNNIIILALGGSYAYGTNNESSDLDVRGCVLNNKMQILTNQNFEQFVNEETDTTIYAFNKLISLLTNVNPNTIEMLGNKAEHYLYVHPIGRELINNAHLFLSKKATYSFGEYATAQLRRLENKSNRLVGQEQLEEYIYHTLLHVADNFEEKYGIPAGQINLYIDKAVNPDMTTEIFMDANLKHYPVRDYAEMWAELKNIIKSYKNIGARNNKTIEHNKLGKHMMHLIRLYMMCLDILENEKIVTYRETEHDLLMDIRNGKYLDGEKQPTPEFYEMVNEYEKRIEYAKNNTSLPDKPNYDKINEFVASVNERVVKGEF